ncbi:MAG: hypothetical protein WBR26_12770 [Candidatus Acidiferrum sp.]
MKRLILGLCAVMLLAFGPVPKVSAGWWHHHSSPNVAGVGSSNNVKKTKAHREKQGRVKAEPLYSKPKSRRIGWGRQSSPGPMGAGSGEK